MYYYLREVTRSGKCKNFSLGSYYQLCLRNRPEDTDDFNLMAGESINDQELQGYIINNCPENPNIPVFQGHNYFIMASTGETIDAIKCNEKVNADMPKYERPTTELSEYEKDHVVNTYLDWFKENVEGERTTPDATIGHVLANNLRLLLTTCNINCNEKS